MLVATDWLYLGEGNQNLVVSYIGKDPMFHGKVLRVLKYGSKQYSSSFKQNFIQHVIKPLLGSEYVLSMMPILTTASFLTQLANNIESNRPESRRNTKMIIKDTNSFLMNDLTTMWTLPTLTFELKPKWGFKPTHSKESIKRHYCRFCMHSHFKKMELHGYCPLDLYSQDPERLDRALHILLNHPLEKNLRVSINGQRISLVDQDPGKLYASLLDINGVSIHDILKTILLQDPILYRLKTLQQTLDQLDIENIYPLYSTNPCRDDPADINTWQHVVRDYQQRLQSSETNVSIQQRIFEYVLSMTFKDCSIMINVAPSTKEQAQKHISLDNGLEFQYDIKVIDLDLKSIEKIPYWYELDQSIINHALKTHFHKVDCQ